MWELSEREFYRELVVAREREIDAVNRDTALAWRIAKLHRSKLPDLDTLLIKTAKSAPQKQSVGEQRQMLHAISQAYNLKLRKGRKRGH